MKMRAVLGKLVFLALSCCILVSSKDDRWDYIKFTQQWPPSVCMGEEGKDHHCVIGKNVTTWTIHGLWPTKGGELGPNYCNNSYHFNSTSIQSLVPQLMEFWPNLFVDTPLDDFWQHEWTKHGTCALSLPELGSEYKYFNMGLQLNKHYSLYRNFQAAAITPSDTNPYNLTQYEGVLKKYYGGSISCTYDEKTKKQFITQIAICLNKNFIPIDCHKERKKSPADNSLGSCRPNELVYYPTFSKHDYTLYFNKKVDIL